VPQLKTDTFQEDPAVHSQNDDPIPRERLNVREARLEDPIQSQAVLELLDAYASDPMGDGQRLTAETRERLIPELKNLPGALVLLAWEDDRPVGIAVCFTGYSTFRARPLFNIHDLAVLPAYRGLGIGKRLLQAVEAEASARGCCKVTLEVREDNPVAQGLYEQAGFAAGTSGGKPIQYLFLEKRL
jgi:ribosomal protein S18 acetylase RimI-like enzyme